MRSIKTGNKALDMEGTSTFEKVERLTDCNRTRSSHNTLGGEEGDQSADGKKE